jgi:hypothetical protein
MVEVANLLEVEYMPPDGVTELVEQRRVTLHLHDAAHLVAKKPHRGTQPESHQNKSQVCQACLPSVPQNLHRII